MLLFLGAGASNAFGIPTTLEFIRLFDNDVREETTAHLYADVKSAFPSYFDLEILMTVLDDLSKPNKDMWSTVSPHTTLFLKHWRDINQEWYDQKDRVRETAHQLLQDVKATIRKECVKAVTDRQRQILDTYGQFFKELSELAEVGYADLGSPRTRHPNPLHIFTTNYDTCIESYCNRRRINFVNGVRQMHGENVFMPQVFRQNSQGLPQVIKLHGSIDYFQDGELIRQVPGFSTSPLNAVTPYGQAVGSEFLVYPIESSGVSHASRSPHLDLYSLFMESLSNQREWVVVGFSFRDQTIASVMNQALISRQIIGDSPRVLLIDPNEARIREWIGRCGYKSLSESVKPVPLKFGEDTLLEGLPKAWEQKA